MTASDVRLKGFQRRSSVDEVLALIEAKVEPLGVERVPFRSAAGRILAEDISAPRDVPPHPRSAMDGYAVRAADVPGTLAVIGEQVARDPAKLPVGRGQAVRIMTGAQIPPGADQVVMVEETRAIAPAPAPDAAHPGSQAIVPGLAVEVRATPKVGQHILETGSDLKAGQIVLPRGRRLRPADVAMLASVGALEVLVQRRPRVRIIPTGSELIPAGAVAEPGQVVESNSFMLEALARRDGAEPSIDPIVPDDLELLRRAMVAPTSKGAPSGEPSADVVVLTGGSSVGREDYGPVVVREVGELWVHGIDVRPASPTGIGRIGRSWVVLAPGYPVASYVAWDLFVRPIVQRLGGAPAALPYPRIEARLAREHQKPKGRVELNRVVLSRDATGALIASALPGGAAILSTLTRADGFVLLPAGQDVFPAGAAVDVHLYEG